MGRLMKIVEAERIQSASELVPGEPMTVRIEMASKLTGISRSQIYVLIKAGRLEAVKVGKANLVRYSSLKRLLRF